MPHDTVGASYFSYSYRRVVVTCDMFLSLFGKGIERGEKKIFFLNKKKTIILGPHAPPADRIAVARVSHVTDLQTLPTPGGYPAVYRNSSMSVPPCSKCTESEHLSPGGGTKRSPHDLTKIWHFGAGPHPRVANPSDSGRTPRAVPELGSGEGGWNKAPRS